MRQLFASELLKDIKEFKSSDYYIEVSVRKGVSGD